MTPISEPDSEADLCPGQLLISKTRVLAGTGTVPVQLGVVQPEGKRSMAAVDWVRGIRNVGQPLVLG